MEPGRGRMLFREAAPPPQDEFQTPWPEGITWEDVKLIGGSIALLVFIAWCVILIG